MMILVIDDDDDHDDDYDYNYDYDDLWRFMMIYHDTAAWRKMPDVVLSILSAVFSMACKFPIRDHVSFSDG